MLPSKVRFPANVLAIANRYQNRCEVSGTSCNSNTAGTLLTKLDKIVLTAIDRQPLSQMNDLWPLIQQVQADQKATLELLRRGKSMRVSVTLTPPPTTMP